MKVKKLAKIRTFTFIAVNSSIVHLDSCPTILNAFDMIDKN
jgi:hypothetical protein